MSTFVILLVCLILARPSWLAMRILCAVYLDRSLPTLTHKEIRVLARTRRLATDIGLLGSVVGLMIMGKAGGEATTALAGLSTLLTTTFIGLVVRMICTVAHEEYHTPQTNEPELPRAKQTGKRGAIVAVLMMIAILAVLWVSQKVGAPPPESSSAPPARVQLITKAAPSSGFNQAGQRTRSSQDRPTPREEDPPSEPTPQKEREPNDETLKAESGQTASDAHGLTLKKEDTQAQSAKTHTNVNLDNNSPTPAKASIEAREDIALNELESDVGSNSPAHKASTSNMPRERDVDRARDMVEKNKEREKTGAKSKTTARSTQDSDAPQGISYLSLDGQRHIRIKFGVNERDGMSPVHCQAEDSSVYRLGEDGKIELKPYVSANTDRWSNQTVRVNLDEINLNIMSSKVGVTKAKSLKCWRYLPQTLISKLLEMAQGDDEVTLLFDLTYSGDTWNIKLERSSQDDGL